MTKDLKGDRWTCPNDRNLQLRSKLNSGWSIHTGKKPVKKDPQLTEAELIEIQKVLQRSEALERNERDRVMKLVDRLENMKRNANQAGCNPSPNRCALCGDFFCLLRTAPTQCSSCHKILCNKCCIDTECTVDSDASSNPSQSRRNSSSSMTSSFIGSSSSNAKVVVYLCRICSEQREFLKKSGAWFMKKFPNYLSDGTNNPNSNSNTSNKYNSTSNVSQLEKSNTSPTQIKQNAFASPLVLKRNISTSSSNSSSFRFWKFKENTSNYANDVPDNVSDFSIDNDRNESNSNCDSNSVPTASRDNLINNFTKISTPTSTKQDVFQFNTSYTTNSNLHSNEIENLKIQKNSSSTSSTSVPFTLTTNPIITSTRNPLNTDTSLNDKKNPLTKNPLSKMLSNNSKDNKTKEPICLSDDDPSSPNMSSYKYYSNIITNLSTSPVISNNNNETIFTSSIESKTLDDKKVEINGTNNSKNGFRVKKLSVSSITDEILNNSLSASASNLNLETNHSTHLIKTKCETSKLPRKNKNSEWCSTQLSMDDEKNEKLFEKLSSRTAKTKPLASSCTDNTGSSLSINGIKPKLSSLTVNNLAKKIANQNSSLTIGSSIAGSGSSAVQSVSSLTTSLAKLNFK